MIVLSVEILAEHKSFFVSMVYGYNSARERISLWNELRMLSSSLGGSAWVIMGDFNVVRTPAERVSGFDEAAATDFNRCLDDINMHDMVTKGF